MKNVLLVAAVLLCFNTAFGQDLTDSRTGSYYTFIYKITNEEAVKLYQNESKPPSNEFFHSLFDFYPADSIYKKQLPVGHYLLVNAVGATLETELQSVNNVEMNVLNNSRDLLLVFQGKDGKEISSLVPKVGNHPIPFDEKFKSYRLEKTNRQGWVEVVWEGHQNIFGINRKYNNTLPVRVKRRVLSTFPINHIASILMYVPRNVMSLIRYQRVTPPGIYYRVKRIFEEKSYDGYLVLNKPKYRPGDTVKLKAFVVTKNSRPVSKKLVLRINGGGNSYISKRLTDIQPYRAGAYVYEFVLTDSLKLSLDSDYYLTLEDRRYNSYPGESFHYEQYELKQNVFSLTAKPNNTDSQPATVLLKGIDTNDLPLYDIQAEVIVKATSVKNFYEKRVFVPDTLWKHQRKLEPLGDTQVTLPDSAFVNAALDYEVVAAFTNADNERQVKTMKLAYDRKAVSIEEKAERDSITFSSNEHGTYTLEAFNSDDDLLYSKQVSLPHREKLESFVNEFQLRQGKAIVKSYPVAAIPDQLNVMAQRTKDSLVVVVENPRKILFRYQLFHNNRMVETGNGMSYTTRKSASYKDEYHLSVQYLWADAPKQQNYDFPFATKPLAISIDHPLTVFPGQSVDMTINVRDAFGHPVKNADLIAYARTKKFGAIETANIRPLERFRSRKVFNEFRANTNSQAKSYDQRLKYDFWRKTLGLDSISYYHFLYPDSGMYSTTVPAVDSITQVAPYVVKNGIPQEVYYIYFGKELKYYYEAAANNPYSFSSWSGKQEITLRLRDTLLTVRDVEVTRGMKTILSIDLKNLPAKARAVAYPQMLSMDEATRLWPHFIWVNRDEEQSRAFFEQGNFYHLMSPTAQVGSRYQNLAGPFISGALRYESDFSIGFNLKPGRVYTFSSRLVDRESTTANFRNYLWHTDVQLSLKDQVLTRKSIYDYWKKLDTKTNFSFRKYPDNTIPSRQRGGLTLKVKNTPPQQFRLATFILNLTEPDEYYIYPGNVLDFGSLRASLYQVVIIFSDETYLRPKPIDIKPYGRTFYDLTDEAFIPADAFSNEVMKKVKEWSETPNYGQLTRQKEMQSLRELYYQEATDYTNYTNGRWITGRITSAEDGSLLPGVNVIVKGTTNGTVTDVNGEYRIYVPANATLVFSFIGLKTQEQNISNQPEGNAQLHQDVTQLSEVVVVGYSMQSKRELTGSIATVSNMLAGQVAGVQIKGMAPGAADTIAIRVRGARSITSDNQALVVIDGVLGKMGDVDQSKITSIEILKSEQAIAIYGSRAAGGVILISTKPGMTTAKLLQTRLPNVPQLMALDANVPGTSLRKNFRDYAFWQPRLKTDEEGKAKFKATFPDDITGWNIHVIGMAAKKHTGETQSRVQSFKPLLAQLALPNFLIAGDSSWAVGKVTNYTADTLSINRSVVVGDNEIGIEKLNILNSRIDSVLLTTGAKDSVVVKYQIEYNGYRDGEQRKLPVFPVGVEESKGVFMALPRDTTFTLSLDDGQGKIKLYAQADMLDVLRDEIGRIKMYPYECNEQLASKLKVLLAEKTIFDYKGEKFKDDRVIEKIIRKLTANQYNDGGWAWWGSGKASNWISRHVAEAFDWAQKLGYKVMFDKVALKNYFMTQDDLPAEEHLKTFIYLTKAGEKTMAKELIDTLSRKNKLYNNYYKLLAQQLLQLSGREPDWKWMEQQRHETLKGNWYWGEEKHSLWNNDIDNTLIMYQIMEAVNPDNPDLIRLRNYFLEARRQSWHNTYESAKIIETLLPGLLKQKGKSVAPVLDIEGAERLHVTQFPFEKEIANSKTIQIRKTGDAPVYFTAYHKQWNAAPEKVEKDFVIRTHWENNRKALQAGKPVTLEVSLEVKKDADYVMINVPIPAGCSYELKNQSRLQGEVHWEYDLHETRIYAEKLRAGNYTYSIKLQPRYKGRYQLNPAKAEWMYFPVVFGREDVKKVVVE